MAINLRSIFWCKITPVRGMFVADQQLTNATKWSDSTYGGWLVISLNKLMLSPMATEHSEIFYRAFLRVLYKKDHYSSQELLLGGGEKFFYIFNLIP